MQVDKDIPVDQIITEAYRFKSRVRSMNLEPEKWLIGYQLYLKLLGNDITDIRTIDVERREYLGLPYVIDHEDPFYLNLTIKLPF